MGNGVLRISQGLLTLVLGVLIGGLLWAHYVNRPVQEIPTGIPQTQQARWQWITMLKLANGSFQVPRWRAWTVTIRNGGSRRRSWIAGRFASDKPIMFAVLTPENFSSLERGYPFYTMCRTGPTANFSYQAPPGTYDVVFFQPGSSNWQMPTLGSTAGLIALAINGIVSRQPAKVTATILVNDWFLVNNQQAQVLRERFQQQGAETMPPLQ